MKKSGRLQRLSYILSVIRILLSIKGNGGFLSDRRKLLTYLFIDLLSRMQLLRVLASILVHRVFNKKLQSVLIGISSFMIKGLVDLKAKLWRSLHASRDLGRTPGLHSRITDDVVILGVRELTRGVVCYMVVVVGRRLWYPAVRWRNHRGRPIFKVSFTLNRGICRARER